MTGLHPTISYVAPVRPPRFRAGGPRSCSAGGPRPAVAPVKRWSATRRSVRLASRHNRPPSVPAFDSRRREWFSNVPQPPFPPVDGRASADLAALASSAAQQQRCPAPSCKRSALRTSGPRTVLAGTAAGVAGTGVLRRSERRRSVAAGDVVPPARADRCHPIPLHEPHHSRDRLSIGVDGADV
jgi:hypothetical protein